VLTELAWHREHSPGALAVRSPAPAGWAETTWAELHEDAVSVAAHARDLRGRGRVVVIVDGSAASVATILGFAGAGVDVLLVEENSSYLADPGSAVHRAGASTVIGPATDIGTPHSGRPSGASDSEGACRAPHSERACGTMGAALNRLTYQECRARSGAFRLPAGAPAGEILQLTSGSTGEPRIARQPLRNVRHGGHIYRQLFDLTDADVILAAVPLAHSFGLIGGMAASVMSGAALWTLPRFSIRQLLDGLRGGATVLLGTPLVYRLLAPALRSSAPRATAPRATAPHSTAPRSPRDSLAAGEGATASPFGSSGMSVRTALSSGGPLPADLAAEVSAGLSVTVRQVYGSTEAGLIACQPDPAQCGPAQPGPAGPWPAGAVGVAAPGVRLRIEPDSATSGSAPSNGAAPNGAAPDRTTPGITPDGTAIGQLLVRTPTLFAGYLGAPNPPSGPHGTYPTGDLARIDDRGRLFIVGRKDAFVNVGGRKVSPRRIERILSEYQGLRDVYVYGMAAADQEQRLHAAVVLKPGARIEDIIEFCRSRRLAPYEVPHHVHVMESLPRTGMGKVDRRRVIAATTAGRAGNATHDESEG
jgi:acyl-CoA synthetase (AMP-forming)/AMP-acid ligase II